MMFRLMVVTSLVWVTATCATRVSPTAEGTRGAASLEASAVAAAHASATIEAIHAAVGMPGVGAAIAVDGQIVWQRFLGFADRERGSPVTEQTRFRIGSVSKVVAAISLARIWDAGLIDLDADIRRYVPAFPDKNAVITPRMLAGHLGGIRGYVAAKDFTDGAHIDQRDFPTTAAALSIFAGDSLIAEPGTRYQYSVFGYTLLSAAMESAAERPFLEIVDGWVLGPLGLTRTGADSAGGSDRATSYERSADGGAADVEPLNFSYKWAGGGLNSTAPELARLGTAVLDNDFLSDDARDLFMTPQRTRDGKPTEVGLGWRIAQDFRGRPFLHHAGNIAGGRAVLLVYPAHGLAVAITSNQTLAPLAIESTAQVLVEPYLLDREGTTFEPVTLAGDWRFRWTAAGTAHDGALEFDAAGADGRIDLHPALGSWSAGLRSPIADDVGRLGPALFSRGRTYLPVITPAGAFALDLALDSADAMSGNAVGQYLRVSGSITAERIR